MIAISALRHSANLPGRDPAAYLADARRLASRWDEEAGTATLSDEARRELARLHPILTGVTARPAEHIPASYDPQAEALRMRHGGCCGKHLADE